MIFNPRTYQVKKPVSKRAYQIQNLYRFYTEGNLGWDPALEVEVAARTVGLCTLESS